MPIKVKIEGVGTVSLDDSFGTKAPEEQQAIIEEITAQASSSGAPAATAQAAPPPQKSTGSRWLDSLRARPMMNAQGVESLRPEEMKDNDLVGLGRAAARGVPVVGAFLDEANAATNATLDPLVPNFIATDIPGKNWQERYESSLATQRGMDKDFDEAHPNLSAGAKLLGGAGAGGALLKAAPAVGSAALGVLRSGAPLAHKAIAGMASGAGLGAAHGFGEGEGGADQRQERAIDAGKWGAGLGAGIPAVTHTVSAGIKKYLAPLAPTFQELKTAARKAYKTAEQAGVVIADNAWQDMVQATRAAMQKEGLNATLHPEAVAALKQLDEMTGNVTLEQAETARRVVGKYLTSASKRQGGDHSASLTESAQKRIDDLIDNLGPGQFVGRDTPTARASLRQARSLWARSRRAATLEDLLERADLKGSRYNQAGTEKAIRDEFLSLSLSPHRMRGFSDEEKQMIERVVRGGPIANTLRYLGKTAPRGIVSAAGGAYLGSAIAPEASVPAAAAIYAAGELAKRGAASATKKSATEAIDYVLRGGPIPDQQAATLVDEIGRVLLQGANPAAVDIALPAPRPWQRAGALPTRQ